MSAKAPFRSRAVEWLGDIWFSYPAATILAGLLVVGLIVGLILWTSETLFVLAVLAGVATILGLVVLVFTAIDEFS